MGAFIYIKFRNPEEKRESFFFYYHLNLLFDTYMYIYIPIFVKFFIV